MTWNLKVLETIRNSLRPVRARIGSRLRRRYYRNPQRYWERRHLRAGATLEGVGLMGLGADGNALDYEKKWGHVGAILERLRPSEGRSLLDAGCGIGWFSERAAALGFQVEGVDFSAAAIETARAGVEADIRWHVNELHTFEPGRRYDVVMCIDVLFHVVDDELWEATVRRLASLVGGDGCLLIQEQLRNQADPPATPSVTHVRRRTLGDYLETLDGWQLIEHDTYALPAQETRKDLLLFIPGEGDR
jgi:2-polyprenyl-3-methyl-5-hydroxy-6-metoxy-1,4-benzoquinol methylase